tara:strand:- start:1957 stop:2355 length:399 start_codon:yes stop_codon:yes gene_type:complete
MAHFAELNENNIVLRVVRVENSILDNNGIEDESKGIEFLNNLFGKSNWKQTSWNHSFRKNYARIGDVYDVSRDAFIPTKEYPSWILNETTCRYEAPVAHPPNKTCEWDEENQQWINCVDPIVPQNTPNEFLS